MKFTIRFSVSVVFALYFYIAAYGSFVTGHPWKGVLSLLCGTYFMIALIGLLWPLKDEGGQS